jgi:hypothetical protein
MKLPSFSYLAAMAKNSFGRFYTTLLFAICGSYLAMLMVNDNAGSNIGAVLSCSLGLSLSLAGSLFAERRGNKNLKHILSVATVGVTWAYWFWLAPSNEFEDITRTTTYFVLVVVAHLMVAVAPYVGHNDRKGFWRYNQLLFSRFILSGIFSAALFGGLALAIGASDQLFELDLNSDIFVYLWIAVAGVFSTWFFVAGIPHDFESLNEERIFPVMLKVFVQYILIPLVFIYMIILYAYGLKILFTWQLPRGMVSMLIMSYSVVGILAVLLSEPLRADASASWVRLFSRMFFRATLPLIVLLYAATWARVGKYGITESRYFLSLLGLWLGIVSLYFVFSKEQNIRIIPRSLIVIGLLSVLGPWSAFSVSEYSQRLRLGHIMKKYNLIRAGSNKGVAMSADDSREVSAIITYFVEKGAIEKLQPLYSVSLAGVVKETAPVPNERGRYSWDQRHKLEKELATMICTTVAQTDASEEVIENFSCNGTTEGFNISGYSRAHELRLYGNGATEEISDSISVEMKQSSEEVMLIIKTGDLQSGQVDLKPLLQRLRKSKSSDQSVDSLTIIGSGKMETKVIVRSISMSSDKKTPINSLDAFILFR